MMPDYKYDDLQAWYDSIDIERNAFDDDEHSWIGASPTQCLTTLKYGWTEGVRRLKELDASDLKVEVVSRKKAWSEYDGETMDVERYHNERPYLRKRAKKKNTKNARILVAIGERADIGAQQMLWKALAAVKLVDHLESNGIRVEIVAVRHVQISSSIYHTEVTLKRYNEALNLSALCTGLAPWQHRYWGFASLRKMTKRTDMGASQDIFSKTEGDIIINRGQCHNKESALAYLRQVVVN